MSRGKDEAPPKSPADSGEGSSSSSSSNLPNVSLPKVLPSLKETLSKAVAGTNRGLETAEETVNHVRERMDPIIGQASETVTSVAAAATQLYEHRKEYGPVAIAGAAITVGALVTLRRGKLPGAVAATLASGATYGVVYGLDGLEIPKYYSGKKE
jgi:hypothetical protein